MRKMKDSGIEYIGEIPEDWEIHPLYCYFGERKNRNSALEERNLLSLSYGNVVRKDIETVGGLLPTSFNTYNIVEKGDIIIRPTDLQNDKRSLRTGLVKEKGIITSAYIDLKPLPGINSAYYRYLLHAYDIMKVFYNMGNGVRQGLNYDEFSKLRVFKPDVFEQERIVGYLDVKCSEIDSLIDDIHGEIATLEEYKQSLITETVTKGLNKNVPLRDSGTGWMGLTPESWKRTRVKYCLFEKNFRSASGTEEPLSMSQKYGIIPTSEIDVPHIMASYIGAKITEPDDLVLNKLKAHLGVFAVSKYKGLVSPDYAVYGTYENTNPKYLEYLFRTDICINEFKKYITGVGQGLSRLYTGDLFRISISVPDRKEQDEIVDYLNCQCEEIEKMVLEKEEQLKILSEYKKSAIYEFITGKKEVPAD